MTAAAYIINLLDLQLTPAQLNAIRYLEHVGQRFCVDFGYENAEAKAQKHWARLKKTVTVH